MPRHPEGTRTLAIILSLILATAVALSGCATINPSRAGPELELAPPPPEVIPPPPTPPGRWIFEASSTIFEHSVQLKAGETKSLDVTLETGREGPGEVTYTIFRLKHRYPLVYSGDIGVPLEDRLPMPEGLEASIEPSRFMVYPHNTYHAVVTIKTTPELPAGEYILFLDQRSEHVACGGGCITVTVE